MAKLEIGNLLKKRYITFKEKKYEIFEYVDCVIGICFINSRNNHLCNVVSGNNAGIYASFLNNNVNEEEYVFLSDDINMAINNNGNKADFKEIRNNRTSKMCKYYFRGEKAGHLVSITDAELSDYLDSKDDFSEGEFKKSTDISEMYSSIKKTIIAQDEQIMQILTALFKNQKVVNSNLEMDLIAKLKENILIYGSTGTGKTEILKRIANTIA